MNWRIRLSKTFFYNFIFCAFLLFKYFSYIPLYLLSYSLSHLYVTPSLGHIISSLSLFLFLLLPIYLSSTLSILDPSFFYCFLFCSHSIPFFISLSLTISPSYYLLSIAHTHSHFFLSHSLTRSFPFSPLFR